MPKQPRRHEVGFAEVLLAEQGIYRLRIAAAEDLLDEGARLVDETGRAPLHGAKLLLTVQATRATHIFESVIALCRIGRGVPASMLNRALLEEALDVHWVAASPDRPRPMSMSASSCSASVRWNSASVARPSP